MKALGEYLRRVEGVTRSPEHIYAWIASSILGLSTVVWAVTIARLQQGNADQLADGFLFENCHVFQKAQFPVDHTQLLKWPLFWLLGVFHSAPILYVLVTTMLCVVTVGGFAYVLFRIVRQPALLAVLYLSLACVLVLVPAQVWTGLSAPLSMAMVTGRNVEYVLYIAFLFFLLPSGQKYNWRNLGIATALFGVLLASDGLFLVCSLGGAAALVVYAYSRERRELLRIAWVWAAVSSVGWILSRVLRWVLGHVTGITTDPAGSYGRVTSLASVHTAMTYVLKGLLVNFGIDTSAGRLAVLPALLNLLLLGLIIYAGYVIGRRVTKRREALDRVTMFMVLLDMSALAVCAAYIVTNHQYADDARYISITLFAGFVTLATYSRQVRISPKVLYGCGGVLMLGVFLGLLSGVMHANRSLAADPLAPRNIRIVEALNRQPVQILVGDFWRVLPIKEETKRAGQQVLPLASCLVPRQSLISNAWKQDLYTHSFAYLLTLKQSDTPFGTCSIQTVIFKYGYPSSVALIAGSATHPTELLLFYSNGAAKTFGNETEPPTPVFGVPTEGTARPTGSTMVPLATPS